MLPFDCRQSFFGVATFSEVSGYSCRALFFIMHYLLEAPHGLLTTISVKIVVVVVTNDVSGCMTVPQLLTGKYIP